MLYRIACSAQVFKALHVRDTLPGRGPKNLRQLFEIMRPTAFNQSFDIEKRILAIVESK